MYCLHLNTSIIVIIIIDMLSSILTEQTFIALPMYELLSVLRLYYIS